MTLTYPASDLDRRDLLLAALGDHWENVWRGDGLPESLVFASAQMLAEAHQRLSEASLALSRDSTPVFHRRKLAFLTFRQSQLNSRPLLYGEGAVYGPQPEGGHVYKYGAAKPQLDYVLPLPAGLVGAAFLANRISDASLLWSPGIDFVVDAARGELRLREDPFTSELVARRPVFEDGSQVDQEIGLWATGALYDEDWPYLLWGGQWGFHAPSSTGYLAALAALWDAAVGGACKRTLDDFLTALAGDAFAQGQEAVQRVQSDNRHLVIVTDQRAYLVHKDAEALVSEGEEIFAGDALSDTVEVFELGRAEVPPADKVLAIAAGRGLLHPDFGELSFQNASVPLELSYDEGGVAQASFELGGLPTDIDAFWEEVHSRGLAGTTLARLLDKRGPDAETEPVAASLPAEINPAQFLVENVLRCHAVIIKIKTGQLLGLGLAAGRLLRRVLPPWSGVRFILELTPLAAIATMNAAADGSFGGTAGYGASAQLPASLAETKEINDWIGLDATLSRVGGRCI